MSSQAVGDLGFSFRSTKGGDVAIFRHGQAVTILRGSAASVFLAKANDATASEQQQLMARLTGHYKRGNEAVAGAHRRNRRPTDA